MTRQNDFFWLPLLILTVFLFWIPTFNVQPGLSTGDMGRDLYAFSMTLMGKWPCRDFWWQYGPLMPLYYAFWFLIGGVNLFSVRLGLGVIYLLLSVLSYRTLRLFVSPAVAFLAAFAFQSFDMTWTFNHLSALPFLFLSIFCLWKFFLTRERKWSYLGTLALVGAALVKSSAGIYSFAAFYLSLILDGAWHRWEGRKSLILIPFLFGAFVLGIYIFLYWGISFAWLKQCLTVGPEYRSWAASPWINFVHLVLRFTVWERRRLLGVAAGFIFGIFGFLGLKKQKLSSFQKQTYAFVILSLLFFAAANSADYFLMEGLIYRFDFWIFPFLVFFMRLCAEWASCLLTRPAKILVGLLLFLGLSGVPLQNVRAATASKIPERYLDFPHGKVYLGSPLSDVDALKKGTHFILEHTRPEEFLLAIPYDALYCFFSGRQHAVRELIFMEHMHLSEKQEEDIIAQLEIKKVPFVIFSNRYRSEEGGVGYFGKTHCRKLAQYLLDHYQEVQTYGADWETADPRQLHAIKILQRKPFRSNRLS